MDLQVIDALLEQIAYVLTLDEGHLGALWDTKTGSDVQSFADLLATAREVVGSFQSSVQEVRQHTLDIVKTAANSGDEKLATQARAGIALLMGKIAVAQGSLVTIGKAITAGADAEKRGDAHAMDEAAAALARLTAPAGLNPLRALATQVGVVQEIADSVKQGARATSTTSVRTQFPSFTSLVTGISNLEKQVLPTMARTAGAIAKNGLRKTIPGQAALPSGVAKPTSATLARARAETGPPKTALPTAPARRASPGSETRPSMQALPSKMPRGGTSIPL